MDLPSAEESIKMLPPVGASHQRETWPVTADPEVGHNPRAAPERDSGLNFACCAIFKAKFFTFLCAPGMAQLHCLDAIQGNVTSAMAALQSAMYHSGFAKATGRVRNRFEKLAKALRSPSHHHSVPGLANG